MSLPWCASTWFHLQVGSLDLEHPSRFWWKHRQISSAISATACPAVSTEVLFRSVNSNPLWAAWPIACKMLGDAMIMSRWDEVGSLASVTMIFVNSFQSRRANTTWACLQWLRNRCNDGMNQLIIPLRADLQRPGICRISVAPAHLSSIMSDHPQS